MYISHPLRVVGEVRLTEESRKRMTEFMQTIRGYEFRNRYIEDMITAVGLTLGIYVSTLIARKVIEVFYNCCYGEDDDEEVEEILKKNKNYGAVNHV